MDRSITCYGKDITSLHNFLTTKGTKEHEGLIMVLGKVVGTIVTTISHKDYKNRRLLVVQPLVLEGDQPEPNEDFIALDNTQAGNRRYRPGQSRREWCAAGVEEP